MGNGVSGNGNMIVGGTSLHQLPAHQPQMMSFIPLENNNNNKINGNNNNNGLMHNYSHNKINNNLQQQQQQQQQYYQNAQQQQPQQRISNGASTTPANNNNNPSAAVMAPTMTKSLQMQQPFQPYVSLDDCRDLVHNIDGLECTFDFNLMNCENASICRVKPCFYRLNEGWTTTLKKVLQKWEKRRMF